MALTFLLHDPISAEIRTVDSQSDLRILSQLWLIKIWLHLTKEVEAPVDSFKQITVFCKSKLRVVTLFTREWERSIYEKKSSVGPGVFYLLTSLPKLQTFLETLLDLSFPHISTVRHWPCAGMIKWVQTIRLCSTLSPIQSLPQALQISQGSITQNKPIDTNLSGIATDTWC